jgi:hypothetical protein
MRATCKYALTCLTGKPKESKRFEDLWRRWGDNIKVNLK